MSKGELIEKALAFIRQAQDKKKQQEEELAKKRQELAGLQIMRDQYELLAKHHHDVLTMHLQNKSETYQRKTSFEANETKAQTFNKLMDKLFESFHEQVIATPVILHF